MRALVAAAAAWACPGLGHVVVGRPAKALYFGGLVLGVFGLGLLLGEGAAVSTERFPLHWYGQMFAGVPALLADALLGARPTGHTIDRLELGVVFTTVAGILNTVVMVDVYEYTRRRALGS